MALIEGPIFQVAWVVDDIAAAEFDFTDRYGIESWLRIPDVAFTGDNCTYRGLPADYSIHVSLAYAGGQQLELIQPVSGKNLYMESLAAQGPGLHHVAYQVADVQAALSAARDAGLRLIDEVPRTGIRGTQVAFLHPATAGGVLTELVQPVEAH